MAREWWRANQEKALQAHKLWLAANKERVAVTSKKYHQTHLEQARGYERNRNPKKQRVRSLNYYHAHKETILKRRRELYWQHHDEQLEKRRAYYALHPEKIWQGLQEWREQHPEAYRLSRIARLQKRRTTGTASRQTLEKVVLRDKGRCGICHQYIKGRFEFDHIVPVAYGGLHTATNLQIAHPACNRSRGAGRIPVQTRLSL